MKENMEKLCKSLWEITFLIDDIKSTDISQYNFSDEKIASEVSDNFHKASILSKSIIENLEYLSRLYYKEDALRERIEERYFVIREDEKLSLYQMCNSTISLGGEFLKLEDAIRYRDIQHNGQMKRKKKIYNKYVIYSFNFERKVYEKYEK